MAKSALIGAMKKVNTKEINVNGETAEVRELTFNQIQTFSEKAKAAAESSKDDFESNRENLGDILRAGVVGLEEVTDDELGDVPLSTLKMLSEEVMSFNGLQITDDSEGNS